MKNLFTLYLLPAILLLTTGNVMAHSGHLSHESVHGFLHVEHIVILAAVGLVVFLLKILNDK